MDFVGSYIPPSTTTFTPKGNGAKFDDLPVVHEQCTPEQIEMMRNGDYHEIREHRKNIERQPSKIKFIAPLTEDGESLKSIKLTPKNNPSTSKKVQNRPLKKTKSFNIRETGRRAARGNKEKDSMKIFGFRFLRSTSH